MLCAHIELNYCVVLNLTSCMFCKIFIEIYSAGKYSVFETTESNRILTSFMYLLV